MSEVTLSDLSAFSGAGITLNVKQLIDRTLVCYDSSNLIRCTLEDSLYVQSPHILFGIDVDKENSHLNENFAYRMHLNKSMVKEIYQYFNSFIKGFDSYPVRFNDATKKNCKVEKQDKNTIIITIDQYTLTFKSATVDQLKDYLWNFLQLDTLIPNISSSHVTSMTTQDGRKIGSFLDSKDKLCSIEIIKDSNPTCIWLGTAKNRMKVNVHVVELINKTLSDFINSNKIEYSNFWEFQGFECEIAKYEDCLSLGFGYDPMILSKDSAKMLLKAIEDVFQANFKTSFQLLTFHKSSLEFFRLKLVEIKKKIETQEPRQFKYVCVEDYENECYCVSVETTIPMTQHDLKIRFHKLLMED